MLPLIGFHKCMRTFNKMMKGIASIIWIYTKMEGLIYKEMNKILFNVFFVLL